MYVCYWKITEVALSYAYGHTQYAHIYKYFQESESCLPNVPNRREETASNSKCNAIAVRSTHNAIYSTQKCMKNLVLIKHTS